MMLTQRISALAHDLARQCHVVGQGGVGGTSTSYSEEKSTTASGKFTKDNSHSRTRRRKLFVYVQMFVCVHFAVSIFRPKE